MTAWRFAPVTRERWADFERLFEAPGSPKHCWCMVWRPLADRQTASPVQKKQAMAQLVDGGTSVGLLAYDGQEPVGWCSVAPRETFRKLSAGHEKNEADIWSITCFFVRRQHRGNGLAAALLDAAVAHAMEHGAKAVEAYPVDPDSPSFRFMGFRDMFAARGFSETGMAGSRRHVMRLDRL